MKYIYSIALLIIFSFSLKAQKITISGYVKDKESGEVLVGASIYIVGTQIGAFSNQYGFYSLSVDKGEYAIEYSYLGYTTQNYILSLSENVTKNIELQINAEKLQTVVVSAVAQDRNVSSTEMGSQSLQMTDIKLIPVLFGENDILKTIQLMPGVKSAGEGTGGFFVRGGGADQNLILLDEAPVFNASHMLGFFSVFNGDAIRDVKLYKGSMPAEYGGRLSSVLDVKMKEGNMREYHAQGGIGTISSRLAVEGPIKKDTSSFIIAARRTYADMFLLLSKDPNIRNNSMYFYDLNLKTNYTFNEKNRIFLSGYFGRDVYSFRNLFGIDWGNATGTLRWVHLFNSKLFLNSTFIYSDFVNSVAVAEDDLDVKLKMFIRSFNLKEDFQWYINSNNTVKFGVNILNYTFNPGTLSFTTDNMTHTRTMDNRYAIESAIYASNEYKANDFFSVKYGLRISNFAQIGQGTVYYYNSEHIRTDSSTYKKGEIIKNYPSLEPRFSATFRINATNSIKSAVSSNAQYVHLIQNSTMSLPIDYWLPSSHHTPPQKSNQYSIGYFKNFENNMYETSLEFYYKNLKNQIDYENGTNIFLNPNIESYLIYGKGRSYGGELLLQKVKGDFTGWIGYTLSKTEKKFDKLNTGNWFPAKYDRVHDISVVGMYNLSEKIQLSATFVFATGDAVTFPNSKYMIENVEVYYYEKRNNYRLPPYHRADIGLTLDASKREKFKSVFNFSIYNVYNRKNVFMIYFEPENDENPEQLKAYKISVFPFLPSITWNFSF